MTFLKHAKPTLSSFYIPSTHTLLNILNLHLLISHFSISGTENNRSKTILIFALNKFFVQKPFVFSHNTSHVVVSLFMTSLSVDVRESCYRFSRQYTEFFAPKWKMVFGSSVLLLHILMDLSWCSSFLFVNGWTAELKIGTLTTGFRLLKIVWFPLMTWNICRYYCPSFARVKSISQYNLNRSTKYRSHRLSWNYSQFF